MNQPQISNSKIFYASQTLQVSDDSPVALAKSVKNSVQNKGMRNAHVSYL